MLVYKTREQFLDQLPKNCVVAEIGVCHGDNAKNIHKICKPKELVLVDSWSNATTGIGRIRARPDEVWENMLKSLQDHFSSDDSVKIHRGLSLEVCKNFPNDYFDWVYIDASHLYDECYLDLVNWFPKIKVGGFLCGHDYTDNENTRRKNFGVKKAVDQFVEENGLVIDFISGNKAATDYAIRKL